LPGTVFDPLLSRWERRVLASADRAAGLLAGASRGLGPSADRLLAGYLLLAGGAAAAEAVLPGARWAWAGFLGCAAAAAAVTAAVARCGAWWYRGRYVRPASLDPAARQLLARAQAAAGEVLAARVFRAGCLDAPSGAAVLAERQWEIACRLRDLSALSPAMRARPAAAAPGPSRMVLSEVTASVTRRVQHLEEYAARVRAADAAYRAWTAAPGQDARLLNLLAATAADGQASVEVASLIRDADAAGWYFHAA